eukprot:Skav222207  [mRNA]  locus=scaffold3172:154710:156613:- [translate_table: standard]
MSLQCRGTFLEVIEQPTMASSRRRHSVPSTAPADEQSQAAANKLLQNAADTFAWRVEVSISQGSYGHPELCGAPCVRAFYSKCTAGLFCNFCHLEHIVPKMKLNKPNRQFLASLGEAETLYLMLSSLRMKCSQLEGPQQDVMRLVLALIQRRVTLLGGIPAQTDQDSMLLSQRLKKFRVGLLLDLLQTCRQVDATLKSEIKALRSNAGAQSHVVTCC